MFETSLDVLYLVLSGCAVVLTLVVSVFLVRLIILMKQVNQIGGLIERLLDSFERYIRLPARVLFSMTDKAKTVSNFFRKNS